MHVKNIILIFSFLCLTSCKDIPNKPSKRIINKRVNQNKPKLKKRKSIQPYQLSHADVIQLSKLQSYRNPISFYKQ